MKYTNTNTHKQLTISHNKSREEIRNKFEKNIRVNVRQDSIAIYRSK